MLIISGRRNDSMTEPNLVAVRKWKKRALKWRAKQREREQWEKELKKCPL
jgi:hypothetical protein